MQRLSPHLILTRPDPANAAFLDRFAPGDLDGVTVIDAPLLKIEPLKTSITWGAINAVIFTSSNGVRHAGPGRDIPAFCVGRATTELAQRCGWQAKFAGVDAQELKKTLLRIKPGGRIAHLAGAHRRGDIVENLSDAGLNIQLIELYDQHSQTLTDAAQTALAGPEPVIFPLFSPRTARILAASWTGVAPTHLVGMSQAVLDETHSISATSAHVAAEPTAEAMKDAVLNCLRRVEARRAPQ